MAVINNAFKKTSKCKNFHSELHLIRLKTLKIYFSVLFYYLHVTSFYHTAVHCNLSQNGINHQMCPEDMTSQLEEEEESVDAEAVLLDDDSPSYHDVSPPAYRRRPPPYRSVSESELSRVRVGHSLRPLLSIHYQRKPLYFK